MERPVLNSMQQAWLKEIGIDARMLAHFSLEPFAPPASNVSAIGNEARAVPATATQGPNAEPIAAPLKVAAGAPVFTEAPRHAPKVMPDAPLTPTSPVVSRSTPTSADIDGATLQALRDHAEHCQACGLYEVRGRMVFGEGTESAPQWMFIGEAPGEYDDSTGLPFRGRAGELLRAMLASVGIDQEAPAYFTNVLKCRPMGNRTPQADEIAACLPLLRRQIDLLQPACLVALGRVSASALLGRDDDFDELRGRMHSYVAGDGRSIPLIVTHHPATLLLHGQLKAEAWRDLNQLPGVHP